MDNTTLSTAQQIKLKQKSITGFLTALAVNKFDESVLLQIYTLVNTSSEYNDYVGKLYTSVPTVSFTGGAGSGAAGTAVITDGILSGVTVTSAGSGYTSAPTISFSGGGGSGASATAILSSGTVGSVAVNNKSLVSRLVTKNSSLDADFTAL